jgi:hypothetical protein
MYTWLVLETFLLNLSGTYYPLADRGTTLTWSRPTEFLEREGRYLALYIDAVKQGT